MNFCASAYASVSSGRAPVGGTNLLSSVATVSVNGLFKSGASPVTGVASGVTGSNTGAAEDAAGSIGSSVGATAGAAGALCLKAPSI